MQFTKGKKISLIKKGIYSAIGIPALGLGLSFFTFGTYLNSSGFNFLQSFLSSFFAFALPGQFVMAETLLSGGNLLNIFLAVLLTNARLFPMTVYLIPIIKNNNTPKWQLFLISHLVAATAWINMLEIKKKIKKKHRLAFFTGYAGFLWLNSVIFTLLGYLSSNFITKEILIGMVFFNPMYFLALTISNFKEKKLYIIFFLSVFFTPIFYFISSDWAVLLSGFLSGVIAHLYIKKFKLW